MMCVYKCVGWCVCTNVWWCVCTNVSDDVCVQTCLMMCVYKRVWWCVCTNVLDDVCVQMCWLDDVCVQMCRMMCVYKWPNIQDHVWSTKACISYNSTPLLMDLTFQIPVVTSYTIRFNIKKLYILPTHCICMFCVDLRQIKIFPHAPLTYWFL